VLNSLAASRSPTELGVGDAAIQRALANFQGIDRRLQQLGEIHWQGGSALVVDDYGHHPTEVAATLEAVRQGWPERARLVLAFQPHRSRARATCSTISDACSRPRRAAGHGSVRGRRGADRRRRRPRHLPRGAQRAACIEPVFVERVEELAEALRAVLKDGDVVLTMGAGNIGAVANELKSHFEEPRL
jgi:UDP-N-acetylmuramate--alanine ligase